MADFRIVVNTIIELARADKKNLDLMGALKLLWFANGFHLAFTGEPLVPEPFEAWKFGPVHRKAYAAFKNDNGNAVTPFYEYDRNTDDYVWKTLPQGPERKTVKMVYEILKDVDSWDLSGMTHAKGSPWAVINDKYAPQDIPPRTTIPDDLIAKWFRKFIKVSDPVPAA